MAIDAETIINAAFTDCGVKGVGDTLDQVFLTDGLRRLNNLLSLWRTQRLTAAFISREVFSVVANQATYTIGPGADWDTTRPVAITGAGLLLHGSSPAVEIPRAILTDDGYAAIRVKDLTNPLWTAVYFNPTYTDDAATIWLWPTPTTADNDAVIYRSDILTAFASLSDSKDVPPGYEDALEWNLAERLLAPYSVSDPTILALVTKTANQTLGSIKRENTKLCDLSTDPALTRDRRGGYNIQTGNM